MPRPHKFGGRPKSGGARHGSPRDERRPVGPPSHARKLPPRGPFTRPAPRDDAPRARDDRDGAPAGKADRDRYVARDVRIVFEDADFLVVDKPSGMLSASLPGQRVKDPTLFDLVKRYVSARSKIKKRTWIIHRLDKETSGLIIFAKSERAFGWLKEELRAKRLNRSYVAIVEGEFETASVSSRQMPMGTVQSYLYEDGQGQMRSTQQPTKLGKGRSDDDDTDQDAKLAVTHYRVMESAYGKALVNVRLETGRKNQIRVHMQEIKHPIVGDRRYGAATDPIGRVCLHASELGFTHPGDGKERRFFSAAPVAFLKLIGKKGEETQGQPSESGEEDIATSNSPSRAAAEPLPTATSLAPKTSAATSSTATPPASPSKMSDYLEPVVEKKKPASNKADASTTSSSWEHVADWYDDLLEERGSDHHEYVILPNTLRLLAPREGEKVLDVACGQGILCRKLAGLGVPTIGVDAAPSLIAAAQRLAEKQTSSASMQFHVGDARSLEGLGLKNLDGATCIMALMNINPLEPVMSGIASSLRAGGRVVVVVLHPAFRAPGQTSWGFEESSAGNALKDKKRDGHDDSKRKSAGKFRQYRRVDGYLSPGVRDIVMNPGATAKGKDPIVTQTFHRPIQAYVNAFAKAGLLVSALEEWPSARSSEPGPKAAEENRIRREIPMFLAIRGVRQA